MKAILRVLTSIRTSAVLMLLVALLLLATVVVPQRAVMGEDAVRSAAGASAIHRFVIDTLGLGEIATSPLFIAVLALFYLNLVAVMVARTPRILGRSRVKPPAPESLASWLASPRALQGKARGPLSSRDVVMVLRGFGFRPTGVTSNGMYAVKHRHAAFGFLLFHASFLLVCAGGLAIWYTRYVGELRVVEGQQASLADAKVRRLPAHGRTPELRFTLDRMQPAFEQGEATDLRATLRLAGGAPVVAWVNHPARRGAASLLVNEVGLAPLFWLQDTRGFTLDRVAAPAMRGASVEVPLSGGVVTVSILPPPAGSVLPSREALATVPLEVVVREGAVERFRGTIRPGDALPLRGGRLVLTEVRYWGGIRAISERGGGLLIAGFVIGTIGLTWRLLLHRRDLVVGWNGDSFTIAGHGEWFADRDRRELMALVAVLEQSGDGGRSAVAAGEMEVRA